MAWVKIDDGFVEHAKVEGLSDRAFRLHVAGLCHCAKNLTDGLVSKPSLRSLCGRVRASKRHVAELVDAGLWIKHESRESHLINGFLDYNPTAGEVKEKREQARERMQRVRANKNGTSREVFDPLPVPFPKDQVLLGVVDVVDNSLRSVNG